MQGKLAAYVGIGILVLVLVGAVLSQANSLMKKGVALGEANGIIADLRESLKEKREADKAAWDELRADVVECNERVDAAELAGAEWKAKWGIIRRRPARTVTVEIESTTWHESLVEGHGKLLAGLERIRDEDTPFPPG